MSRGLAIPTVILAAFGLAWPALAETIYVSNEKGNSITVIDGDSIVISGSQLDLLGIDAPELGQNCYLKGVAWACGAEASLALAQFVDGKQLDCHEIIIDEKGQLTGRCSIVGLDIGAELVTRGLAVLDPAYRGYYLRNYREARYSGAGILGGRFVTPWEWRDGKRLDPEKLKPPAAKETAPADPEPSLTIE
jgi:endonuclease YncB( thermonuclease family)